MAEGGGFWICACDASEAPGSLLFYQLSTGICMYDVASHLLSLDMDSGVNECLLFPVR